MSKQSIQTWLKKHNGYQGPYGAIAEAVTLHAEKGDHPGILFEGTALELATALYTEQAKKTGALNGLYCTRPEVAFKMAQSLQLRAGMTVLNPGSGLLALTDAVYKVSSELRVINIENQDWLVQACQAAGRDVWPGDFLELSTTFPEFDAVIVNPPWGKMWGYGNIDAEFMTHIVARAKSGTRIAALLGGERDYWFEKLKRKYQGLQDQLRIIETQYYQNGASLPKSIPCTRYLLEVQA